jgi:hypothetical protein
LSQRCGRGREQRTEELGKVDLSVSIRIDLVDHVLKFRLGRVLAEGTHDGAEFAGGDRAVAIWVNEASGLSEMEKARGAKVETGSGGKRVGGKGLVRGRRA